MERLKAGRITPLLAYAFIEAYAEDSPNVAILREISFSPLQFDRLRRPRADRKILECPDSSPLLAREYIVVDALIAFDHRCDGKPFSHSSRAVVFIDGPYQRQSGDRLSYAIHQKTSDAVRNHLTAGT